MIKSKNTLKNSVFLSTLAGFALATSAHGAIIFTDSFESPNVAAGTRSTSLIPAGWDRPTTDPLDGDAAISNSDRAGLYGEVTTVTGSDQFTTSFGDQAAWVWGGNGGQFLVTNDTGLSSTVAADTQYTLSWNYGGDRATTASYDVYLLADDGTNLNVLNAVTGSFSGIQDTSGTDSFTFTTSAAPATLGDTLRIRIEAGLSTGGVNDDSGFNDFRNDVIFDNVELDATVIPEPSVAILGSFGLLALLRRRR